MNDFYDIVEDISNNVDDINLRIEDVWTGIVDLPDEYAEDFENAVCHFADAKGLIDKIFTDLYEKRHDED